MSNPKWSDLLVNVERFYPACGKRGAKLSTDQVEQLRAVENAGESFNISILHGVAAVGELLAHASTTQGLSEDVVYSAGWLISSLALLSMSMTESAEAAKYNLQHLPHKGQSDGQQGGVQ